MAIGKRAISEATYQDSASGGVCRVYFVSNGSWKIIEDGYDNNKLVWEHRRAQKVDFISDGLFLKKWII